MSHREPAAFLPLDPAATRLGIPLTYLRREVARGTIPHLRIGPRILVHVREAEAALTALARVQGAARSAAVNIEAIQ